MLLPADRAEQLTKIKLYSSVAASNVDNANETSNLANNEERLCGLH
jgi:hypothetical protein